MGPQMDANSPWSAALLARPNRSEPWSAASLARPMVTNDTGMAPVYLMSPVFGVYSERVYSERLSVRPAADHEV
ncbi:MAG TPA: hypothetical protein VK673_17330 [Chthoniobacterales bacterium]|nr:hypothetical protein [Chthoniobacterales bacterium]